MKKSQTYYIIDFDSTFTTVEALDELAKIALDDHPQKEKITQKIKEITRLGMEGKIGFEESLTKRLALFKPKKEHIIKLISLLQKRITPSIVRNSDFFVKNAKHTYIISGGFSEYIYQTVKPYGFGMKHVLANNFRFDKNDTIIGFDSKNP